MSKDYEWFIKADMRKYKGKYVLIKNKKVIFSGERLDRLMSEFRKKYPGETPLITKIPEDEVLILVIVRK